MENVLNGFLAGLGGTAYGAVESLIDDQINEAGEWIAAKLVELAEDTDTPWDDEALEKVSCILAAVSRTIDEKLGLEDA
ncbi:MAG: hypothetical protein AAFX52_11075 [Pseudomonadota bacterium]